MKSKKNILVRGTAALIAVLAGSAVAADSITVPVSATIQGVCKFFTSPVPTLYIVTTGSGSTGYIDPSLAAVATGSVNVDYKCTKGQSPTFALTGGSALTLTGPASSTMIATMSIGTGSAGLGFAAAAQSVTLTGTIASTIYQGANAGTYTGSQTVTVNP